MEQIIPDDSNASLAKHAVARDLIGLCASATRQWINGEVSRDYLLRLTGLVGVCVANAKYAGLDGHNAGGADAKKEADGLLAKLVEMRELLRYPRYAAASLDEDESLTDSPELRQRLVDQHIASEPGFEFPAP